MKIEDVTDSQWNFFSQTSILKETVNDFDELAIIIHNSTRRDAIIKQAKSQLKAAGNDGSLIRWEISTELGAQGVRKIFQETPGLEKIQVSYKPQINIIK